MLMSDTMGCQRVTQFGHCFEKCTHSLQTATQNLVSRSSSTTYIHRKIAMQDPKVKNIITGNYLKK